MLVLTAEEARRVDRLAIERYKIPLETLIENAGRGAFQVLQRRFPDLSRKKVVVVAGKGNNGGDGRILARLLKESGVEVRVWDMTEIPPLPNLTPKMWGRGDFDIVVDALFGTGLSRVVTGEARAAIEAINGIGRSGKFIFSLDIPSGLSADDGEPLGVAVKADLTAVMGLPKLGLLFPESASYVGRMSVVDIGIPETIYREMGLKVHWITEKEVGPLFRPRENSAHKGDFGHLLLIGGSASKPGAILLAGRAALRTGAGRVTVALPEKAFRKSPLLPPFSKGGGGDFLELMYEPLRDWKRIEKVMEGKNAVAAGPGLGVNAGTAALVSSLVLRQHLPLLLDADALNCIALRPKILLKRRSLPLVLTPHPGEMARLTGRTTRAVQKDRIGIARDFASEHGVYLVLKGFRTVTATPTGDVFINSTGNPGMATAGMGDVLTGIIGSLVVQGIPFEKAVVAGVYLHGRAGDRLASRLGDRGILAGDLIEEIPLAIKEIVGGI